MFRNNKMSRPNLKMTIVFVTTLLFFLLSPGVILTLPPTPNKDSGADQCGVWFQLGAGKHGCATNWPAVVLHTLLFGLLMYVIIESLMGKMRRNLLSRFKF
jgi:hypothetical protein